MRTDNVLRISAALGPWVLSAGQQPSPCQKAATFIYANMPNKLATYDKPKLTVEESFDVAAFINDDRIHKRPGK